MKLSFCLCGKNLLFLFVSIFLIFYWCSFVTKSFDSIIALLSATPFFLCATYTSMMLCEQKVLSLFVLIFLIFYRCSFVMKSFDSNNDFNINIIRLKERLFIISVKRYIYLNIELMFYLFIREGEDRVFIGMIEVRANSH